MTSLNNTRTTYGTASFANRAVAFFSEAAIALTAWNDARVTRNALSDLTDRELADIGLSRGEIDSIARSNIIR